MRVVFMGTPEIAAAVLESLAASKHEIVGVVTQPDRPNARGNEIIFSAVKKVALDHGFPVYQPEKASDETFAEQLRELNPDIIVVAAYGQILRENILNLPRFRCVNVHASILPRYRGASPIQWAVINGERQTGITIMYMEKGLDTGDMILTKTLEIAPDETAGTLHDRLSELAGPTLLEALELIEEGKASPVKQNEEEATYYSVFKKSMGELEFNKSSVTLERLIRGLIPWPGAFTYVDGKMLKIWKTEVSGYTAEGIDKVLPGRIFTLNGELYIETADGSLKILELQLEGKKRMSTDDFMRGFRLEEGSVCKR